MLAAAVVPPPEVAVARVGAVEGAPVGAEETGEDAVAVSEGAGAEESPVAGAAVPEDVMGALLCTVWPLPQAVSRPSTATEPANRAPRRADRGVYTMSLNTPGWSGHANGRVPTVPSAPSPHSDARRVGKVRNTRILFPASAPDRPSAHPSAHPQGAQYAIGGVAVTPLA